VPTKIEDAEVLKIAHEDKFGRNSRFIRPARDLFCVGALLRVEIECLTRLAEHRLGILQKSGDKLHHTLACAV